MTYELINGVYAPANKIINGILDPVFNYDDIINKAYRQLLDARPKLKTAEHSFTIKFEMHYKGRHLGKCTSFNLNNDTMHTISIHRDLFLPEHKWKLDNTVKHELTHALIFMVFGNVYSPYYNGNVKPHGREFKYFGRVYFNETLNTTCKDPTIVLTPSRKLVRYAYHVPDYGVVEMTKGQHAKLQTGSVYRLSGTRHKIMREYYQA